MPICCWARLGLARHGMRFPLHFLAFAAVVSIFGRWAGVWLDRGRRMWGGKSAIIGLLSVSQRVKSSPSFHVDDRERGATIVWLQAVREFIILVEKEGRRFSGSSSALAQEAGPCQPQFSEADVNAREVRASFMDVMGNCGEVAGFLRRSAGAAARGCEGAGVSRRPAMTAAIKRIRMAMGGDARRCAHLA